MKLDKNLYKDIGKPTIVMICICLIVTLALSVTNLVTAPKIEKLTKESQQASMKKVLAADDYKEQTLKYDDGDVTYYEAEKGGELAGYIFITSAKGYGGDVSVMTALDTKGEVTAIEILDVSNETPGLGQNATKEDFYSQFIGKSSNSTAVKHGTAKQDSEIDAVTGATITSRAVTKAVNKAIECVTSGDVLNDTQKGVAE